MANRWCDGLGRYGGDKTKMLNGSSGQAWAQVDGGIVLSSANPRTGSWHLRVNQINTTYRARRVFGAALDEVFLGFAIFCHALPAVERRQLICELSDQGNGSQVTLWLGTDGALELCRGYFSPTVIARTIPIIGAGAYQHLEIYAKAGNGDGAFELRVDEVPRLNLTGIDTVATANVEFSQMQFGPTAGVGGGQVMVDYADFFCNDAVDDGSACSTFIGDCKSAVLMASGDTAQADFALSAGASGFALIDDTPPDDATYLSTTSASARSDFALANGPANMSEVLTVRPFVRAMKDDAGTCTIAPNVESGASVGTVAGQPITTAFAYYDSNVPVDPATGVPWTPAGLNAAELVVERTA